MAPRQRKNGGDSTEARSKVKDSTPQTDEGNDGLAAFMPGGKHATKIQLGLMLFVVVGTCINVYLYPPDRTRFRESYRAPLKWYDQFADEYASLATSWGYNLPAMVAERLHVLHKEAGVDVHDARVLEIGAGGGLVGIELHRLGYRPIIGLDISSNMAPAHTLATKAYEMFVTADAETVPMKAIDIKNGSLDAVLCLNTAGYLARGLRGGEQDLGRHFDGKELPPEGIRVNLLLEEWLRVLKPEGILGLSIESHLAEVWEAEQKQLVARLRLHELEVHDALSIFPLHKDKEIREARTRLYFYKRLVSANL